MDKTMTLLKPLNNSSFLIPYKQLFIQFLHQKGKLIAKQSPGELNLLLQLVIDPSQAPTWHNQLSSIIYTVHTVHQPAPQGSSQQHQGMYSFTLNTNNPSSTNMQIAYTTS